LFEIVILLLTFAYLTVNVLGVHEPRFERRKIIHCSIVPGILATPNTASSKHHPVLIVQANIRV